MLAALLRLVTIVALAAMPLGMAATPIAASPMDHPSAAMSDHCAEPSDESDSVPGKTMDCKAACSALPASSVKPAEDPVRPPVPRDGLAAVGFDDTLREIATPPPRLG